MLVNAGDNAGKINEQAYLLDGLVCCCGQHTIDIAAQAHKLSCLIVNVCCNTPSCATGMVQHDVGVWQRTALALQQNADGMSCYGAADSALTLFSCICL